MRMKDARVWAAFCLLGMFWGASFLFIKIALGELRPITLVALRLGIGTLGLWTFVIFSRPELPSDGKTVLLLAVLGIFNPALPFLLITWGQQFTGSAIAGVLNGTVPLFSMIFAHFVLPDERITLRRVIGLVIGFLGILLIFGEDVFADVASNGLNPLLSVQGQLAVVGAASLYGGTAVLTRRSLRDVNPLIIAAGSQITALIVVSIGALTLERSPLTGIGLQTWGALGWLGLLGTSLAYVFLFYIIREWGATRATLVTYVIPVVAFALGAIVLKEEVTWLLVAGGLLIIGAIVIVNQGTQTTSAPHASEHVHKAA